MGRNKVPIKCKHVFKNGAKVPDKEQYTKKDMQTLTNTDIALAIERLKKGYGKSKKNNNTIGFA